MISLIIITILIIICLICLYRIIFQRKILKSLDEQLKFIYENETNKEITLSSSDKEISEISKEINKILEKNKQDNITLRQMQKSMRNTLTSISHDLRTPLTSISGYLQMIERNETSEEKRKEYLTVVNKRVDNVKNILEQLFQYIRLENNEFLLENEEIKVDNLLKDTIAIYYYDYLNKNIEPEILIPEKNIIINGDKNGLKRVFSNIIYNSLIHGEKDYKIEVKETKEKVELEFSNYTTSINHKDVEFVFERFFTSDKSKTKQTTGLGLCISKLLIEKMNGKIEASIENNIFKIKIELKK